MRPKTAAWQKTTSKQTIDMDKRTEMDVKQQESETMLNQLLDVPSFNVSEIIMLDRRGCDERTLLAAWCPSHQDLTEPGL